MALLLAELAMRLARRPGDGSGGAAEPPVRLPDLPGLVFPERPEPVAPGGGFTPLAEGGVPPAEGFTPAPGQLHVEVGPAAEGPPMPNVMEMARPRRTPEELERQRAIIRAAGLPTEGDYPYVPPRTGTSSQKLPREGGAYRDANGSMWRWHRGVPGGSGLPFDHWDVTYTDDRHRNIMPNGMEHHRGTK